MNPEQINPEQNPLKAEVNVDSKPQQDKGLESRLDPGSERKNTDAKHVEAELSLESGKAGAPIEPLNHQKRTRRYGALFRYAFGAFLSYVFPVIAGGIIFGRIFYEMHMDVTSAVDYNFSVGQLEKKRDSVDKVKHFAFDNEHTRNEFILYVQSLVEKQPEFWEYEDNTLFEKVMIGFSIGFRSVNKTYKPGLSALVRDIGTEMDDPACNSEHIITGEELEQAKIPLHRVKIEAIVKDYLKSKDFHKRMKF